MSLYTTPINVLPLATTISSGDQIPIYSAGNGDTRRVPFSAFQAALAVPASGLVSQYLAPSASPFDFPFPGVGSSMWLILTPNATMAVGTIELPGSGYAVDHQVVEVTTTQAVTALTITASGLTVTGAPTTLTANQAFRMRFDGVLKTWFIAA